jgi:hypothetical protein
VEYLVVPFLQKVDVIRITPKELIHADAIRWSNLSPSLLTSNEKHLVTEFPEVISENLLLLWTTPFRHMRAASVVVRIQSVCLPNDEAQTPRWWRSETETFPQSLGVIEVVCSAWFGGLE